MVRTQVYLPEDLYNEVKLLSMSGEGSFSDLLREGFRTVVKIKRKTKKKNDWRAWEDFVGVIKGGSKTNAVKDIQDYYESGVVK